MHCVNQCVSIYIIRMIAKSVSFYHRQEPINNENCLLEHILNIQLCGQMSVVTCCDCESGLGTPALSIYLTWHDLDHEQNAVSDLSLNIEVAFWMNILAEEFQGNFPLKLQYLNPGIPRTPGLNTEKCAFMLACVAYFHLFLFAIFQNAWIT